MKQEHNLDKKMNENTLKKLNQQKKKFLKNNFINIKMNEMLSCYRFASTEGSRDSSLVSTHNIIIVDS